MKPSKLRRLESRRAARESYELAVVLHSLREGRTRLSEAGQLGEAITPERAPASTTEGPRFRVVLISEGLGNRLNLNYYGREAIESAPAIFEGKPCFLNHPAVSEERDIPERRVQDKCGYFKNCQVVESEGRKALEAELHFDLSATGRMAADKARTALHYRSEFPGSAEEYVGLSVNADGLTEVRNMLVDGVLSEVNYVTAFTEAASCDLVTTPARGGKFLALVESIAGSFKAGRIGSTKGEKDMVIKTLESALADLKDVKDANAVKARESLSALLAAAKKVIEAEKKEDEAEESGAPKVEIPGNEPVPKAEDPKVEESEEAKAAKAKAAEADEKAKEAADMFEKGHAMVAKALAMGHKAPQADAPADAAPAAEAKKEGDEAEESKKKEDEAQESKRLAILGLMKEAAIDIELVDMKVLSVGSLVEAKAHIANVKKLTESIVRKLELPAGHPAKGAPSGEASSNQALFSGLVSR